MEYEFARLLFAWISLLSRQWRGMPDYKAFELIEDEDICINPER